MINYIWFFLIAIGIVLGILTGRGQEVSQACIESAKDAGLLCIGLIGAYALWLGVLNVAKKSGLVEKIAVRLGGVIAFLFPGVPKQSDASGYITLNIVANMLGMGNAATPFGLKAMKELDRINEHKKNGKQSDVHAAGDQCVVRPDRAGQRDRAPQCRRVRQSFRDRYYRAAGNDDHDHCGHHRGETDGKKAEGVNTLTTVFSVIVPVFILFIITYGIIKKVNVYDSFVTGAKQGISTALRILPYVVGMVFAIGVFKASGAFEYITCALAPVLGACRIPAGVLPLAVMRPFSGSASLGILAGILTEFGPDSFTGRVASTLMGSTETLFYTAALYFGSVGVKNTRYTIPAALIAEAAGLAASVFLCNNVFLMLLQYITCFFFRFSVFLPLHKKTGENTFMKINLYSSYTHLTENDFNNHNAVVVDALRATTTVITALEQGCRHIVPFKSPEEATEMRKDVDSKLEDTLLGGVRDAKKISGFDFGNSPFEYTRKNVWDKVIFFTTASGTSAVLKAKNADKLFLGAYINASAVAQRVVQENKDTIICCAGTEGLFSADDILAAGAIIDKITALCETVELNDLAIMAQRLYNFGKDDLNVALNGTGHYDYLMNLGFKKDIDYCLKEDTTDVVPVVEDGVVTK